MKVKSKRPGEYQSQGMRYKMSKPVTYSENEQIHPLFKVKDIYRIRRSTESTNLLAKIYKCSPSTIKKIRAGKSFKNV